MAQVIILHTMLQDVILRLPMLRNCSRTCKCDQILWNTFMPNKNLVQKAEFWSFEMPKGALKCRHAIQMFASSTWHQGLKSQGISFVRFMWLRLHIHKLNDVYLFTLFKCNLFITNAFIQKLWFDGVLTVTYAHVIIVTIQCRTFSSFFIKLFCVLYHSVSTPKQSQIDFCQYRYVYKVYD